jgi:hypothetical protein
MRFTDDPERQSLFVELSRYCGVELRLRVRHVDDQLSL